MRPAIVISDRDNVATALEALDEGRRLELGGVTIVAREPIAPGHKIAMRRIAAGEPVLKYGSPIGIASADIEPGAHVHTHNVASARGRGDLEAPAGSAPPRLAEPEPAEAGPSDAARSAPGARRGEARG
jgi:hypothetical protein